MLRSYPCGTAKPRCRGWLHVPMPLAGLVWIVVMLLRGDSLETLLFAFMKSLSYAASVNLHVVPRKFLRTHAVAMWIDCFLIPINAGSYCILVKPGMYNAWAVDLLVMLLYGLGNAYAHWCILSMVCHKDQEDPVIKKRMSFLIRACTVGIVMWTTRSYVIHAGVTWGIVVALLLFSWPLVRFGQPRGSEEDHQSFPGTARRPLGSKEDHRSYPGTARIGVGMRMAIPLELLCTSFS